MITIFMKKSSYLIGGFVIASLNLNYPLGNYIRHLYDRRYPCNFHSMCDDRSTKSTLKVAQVFFRHGRRTPIIHKFLIQNVIWPAELTNTTLQHTNFNYSMKNSLDNDLFPLPKTDIFDSKHKLLNGGASQGKLTTFGQQDAYNLGNKLKKIYVDSNFVDSSFRNSQVRVYSTNLNRTVLSARCVLAGMFDAKKSENADIFTRTVQAEYNLPNYFYCKNYKTLYDKARANENNLPQIYSKKKHIADILGMDVDKMPSVVDIWEEVAPMKMQGISIPPEYEAAFETIKKAATDLFCFRAFFSETKSMHYAIGLVLQDVGNIFDNFNSRNNSGQSLYLNSVHDATIMGLLIAMDCFDGIWPDTSSYLSLELHEINNKYFVKAIYNDKVLPLRDSENGFLGLKSFNELIQNHRLYKCDFIGLCGLTEDRK